MTMKQSIKLFRYQNSLGSSVPCLFKAGLALDRLSRSKFLDWNPQLFREIKGKLTTKNIVIAAAISVIIQFIAVISLLGQLPDADSTGLTIQLTSRFCFGGTSLTDNLTCTKDLLNNWVIDWQLWWLDLFIFLSIASIFALLIVGTYMLIADAVKEQERGTLNFIRLTPQSAGNILLGKILGVPILLYISILCFFPLHFISGLKAQIPLSLISAFYLTITASCAFCYCLALLWSLIDFGVSGFKPWLGTGLVALLLFAMTNGLFSGNNLSLDNPFGWLFLFHPGLVLAYLIDATKISSQKIDFLTPENLAGLSFFGQAWWMKASLGIGSILFNFSLWTYWCWTILKRRFHQPEGTIISKVHSYWLTSWFSVVALGFTLQKIDSNLNYFQPRDFQEHLTENFGLLQICLVIFFLCLIAALTPQRQTLHDWARYRHQTSKSSLGRELVFNENSPATLVMAINLGIAIAFITPSIFMFLAPDQRYIFWGFILSASNIMLYAVIAQFILTFKNRKRAVWSAAIIASLIIVPPLFLEASKLGLETLPQAWLFSFMPIYAAEYATASAIALAIFGQWLAISVIGLQMTRKLKQAGASETKILMSRLNALSD